MTIILEEDVYHCYQSKKVLIDNVPIQESLLEFEEKKLGTKDLEIIMKKNGISHNECLSKKTKKNKTVEEYWQ